MRNAGWNAAEILAAATATITTRRTLAYGNQSRLSTEDKTEVRVLSQDRKAYQRIADRARLLVTHVPENRWSEIQWFEDEE